MNDKDSVLLFGLLYLEELEFNGRKAKPECFYVEWDSSSVGRALVSHIRGQGFNSPLFHIFSHQHIPL